MNLENYPIDKLKEDILLIVSKYLDLKNYKLFFFGSRVRGDEFVSSDIDLGISGSQKISSQDKVKIEEDLEKIPMLYKIDFVDFAEVSADFKKEALKNIDIIIKPITKQ